MRIKSVQIKNFRSFKKQTIEFNSYTCFVGPNGAGKSTVLCALNVFFRESRDTATNLQQLQAEDFHNKDTSEPIVITVTFVDLSAEAQQDFKHYYRQNQLVVSAIATFDPIQKYATVEQHGERLVMAAFSEFFQAASEGKLVGELRAIYGKIGAAFPKLANETTKSGMTSALRDHEEAHPGECELVRSPADFYGVSRGDNFLRKYVEWIYVPAVKDASSEQVENRSNTFGRLVARAVRSKVEFDDELEGIRGTAQASYKKLLEKHATILGDLSTALQGRVSQWAHPAARVELAWDENEDAAITVKDPLVRILASEGSFLGELPRFGNGLQRSYLLALLHELSTSKGLAEPTLILACEEPELFQHPPQARHLASVLLDLSEHGSQVMVSTHSPHFVAGEAFEDVRVVRKDPVVGTATVCGATFEEIAARKADALEDKPKKRAGMIALMHRTLRPNLSEIFFGNRVVLVEGVEDAAFVTSYLHLTKRWDEFRRCGAHIVPTNGKSFILEPLVILLQLQISVFVVFDSDGHESDLAKRALHGSDNAGILRALGVANPNAFPTKTAWGSNFAQWATCFSKQIELEVGQSDWNSYQQAADKEWGYAGSLRKNPLHVASCIRLALEDGKQIPTLDQLCVNIVK